MQFRPDFLCQGLLLQFDEKTALASCAATVSQRPFRVRIRAGGKREKQLGARDLRHAQRKTVVSRAGAGAGRRKAVQARGANSSVELSEAQVSAPLDAAWESIRSGLRRDLGARTFDGWLKPAELGAFEPDTGTLDVVMPSQFMADWVRSHFGERLTLAWKTVLPIVRDVRVIAAADAPRPAPLLILEETPPPAERDPNAPNFDPRYRFETFVVGKANEVAATAARTLATSPDGRLQPALHPRRHRPRQDPPAARDWSCFPRAQPRRASRLDVGREVHGRVHPRAEGKRHDRLQAAAAERRPAADRRRPVHRRQGFDAGRILPHDERDHHRRAAAGDHLGPRPAGPRRDRAAHPVAPVVGPRRRHQRGRSTSFASTSSAPSSRRCPACRCRGRSSTSSRAG